MLTVDIEKTPFYKMGQKEARLEDAVIMIEKFNLSIDAIVKEFNIKKEELLEYISRKNSEESK